MVSNIKYSNTQIEKILKTARIIVDTNEQSNSKILEYFDKKKIQYIRRSLDFCDYSIELPKNDELCVPYDMSFEKMIAVELKHSGGSGLNELAGNLTKGREDFEHEFIMAMSHKCNVILVVSNGSWQQINNHEYDTQYNEKSFYNSLLSWRYKYNIHIDFIKESDLGMHIYRTLIVALKKILE